MDPAHLAFDRMRSEGAALRTAADRHLLALLVVFGSVLEDRTAADVDVAVLPTGALDVIRLIGDLDDAFGPAEFDILDLREASPVARKQALLYGAPLFERSPGLFAETQIAALTEFMETQWLRDLDRRLLRQ